MAAGAWKDWAEGELVTEALFQDIQDSIAFIYASESAANTALTNKVEGTQFFDTGEDKLKIWDGSAWVAVGGGIETADYWILTADLSSSADPISSNLARPTGTLQNNLGSGMSVSSGVWTFPSTGFYHVEFNALISFTGSGSGVIYLYSTNDNGSAWDLIAIKNVEGGYNFDKANPYINALIDVTDTSNDKIKFRFVDGGTANLLGASTNIETGFAFTKLGDT